MNISNSGQNPGIWLEVEGFQKSLGIYLLSSEARKVWPTVSDWLSVYF